MCQDFFDNDEYIIRQGWAGDAFYIINEGSVSHTIFVLTYPIPFFIAVVVIKVKVTQQQENGKEVTKRKLHKGDYFGEKALLG